MSSYYTDYTDYTDSRRGSVDSSDLYEASNNSGQDETEGFMDKVSSAVSSVFSEKEELPFYKTKKFWAQFTISVATGLAIGLTGGGVLIGVIAGVAMMATFKLLDANHKWDMSIFCLSSKIGSNR